MAQYKMQYWSGDKKVQNFKEASTQSFKAGDFVVVTYDTGYIRACATGDAVLTGIALKDASGTAGTDIPVLVILSGTVLMSSVYHATAASAVTAQTQVGNIYDPYYASQGSYLDIGTTTDTIFVVQKLLPEDAVGTQYGRVLFTVEPGALTGCGATLAS